MFVQCLFHFLLLQVTQLCWHTICAYTAQFEIYHPPVNVVLMVVDFEDDASRCLSYSSMH